MTPKLGFPPCPGRSMEDTYLLFMRCPVYSGMTLMRAFAWNLRTWAVMLREKVQVEAPRGRKYRSADQGRTAS
jgi:hypothetical protein